MQFSTKLLFLDGVYVYRDDRSPRFQRVRAPDKRELEDLVQQISQRAGRCLERLGLLEQDAEQACLELDPVDDTDAVPHLLDSSVSYRIAVAIPATTWLISSALLGLGVARRKRV